MPRLRWDLLIRILPQTDSGWSVASFLVNRQARGLSPRTVDFSSELHHLQAYLEQRGLRSVQDTSADPLRRYLLDLGQHRNPGGVQAAHRAMRAFFKWYAAEYELGNWSNPIVRVAAPRVPFRALELSLKDIMTASALLIPILLPE